MAVPRPPEQALFFTGILASSAALLPLAAERLERHFGPSFVGSDVFPFDGTRYYLDELGPTPVRAFLAWPGLYPTEAVADAKLLTNELEKELAAESGDSLPRPVNLDPGYITQAKLVLASAKNYSHRIHIRDNIYAEITLQYRQGAFHTLPWTFPDFATPRYHGFFLSLREKITDFR